MPMIWFLSLPPPYHLFLPWSPDAFSPVHLLTAFVYQTRAALATITTLHLNIDDTTSGSSDATASLWKALAVLVGACPVLTAFYCYLGHLPLAFMHTLGGACPLLTTFEVQALDGDREYLQEVVTLLPRLLPRVHTLGFEGLESALPDMTANTGIHTLEMKDYTFAAEEQWLRLPPDLYDLSCFSASVGPPALMADQSRAMLVSLLHLSLHLTEGGAPVHALAGILQAAPNLEDISYDGTDEDERGFVVQCHLGPSTAADLAVLRARSSIKPFDEATYLFGRGPDLDEGPLQPFIASLSCMPDIFSVELDGCRRDESLSLLSLFPGIEYLGLAFLPSFNDVSLRALTSCAELAHLTLTCCNGITPTGLLALCVRLPQLRTVTYTECDLLNQRALNALMGLLRGYGSEVVFRHRPPKPDV